MNRIKIVHKPCCLWTISYFVFFCYTVPENSTNWLCYITFTLRDVFRSQKEGISMYTKEELARAKKAIAIMAERNTVSEEQIRAEIQATINVSMNSADPRVQTQWAECEKEGSEPTPEEVITWLAKKVNQKMAMQ